MDGILYAVSMEPETHENVGEPGGEIVDDLEQQNRPLINPENKNINNENIVDSKPLPSAPQLTPSDNRFTDNRKCNDKFWLVLFYVQLIIVIGLSVYYFSLHTNKYKSSNKGFINKYFWILCVIVLLTSIMSSVLWLSIVRRFTYYIIWFCLIMVVLLWLGTAILALVGGSLLVFFIGLIFGGITALWIYFVRHRIKFATAILQLTIDACDEFWGIYIVSIFSSLVLALWLLVWSVGVSFSTYTSSNNAYYGLIFFFILSLYWTVQVISNVVFVTCSGIVSIWYFYFPNSVPNKPILSAFTVAATSSFGSICYGSFLVALIQTIKYMVRLTRNRTNACIRCCVLCILSCFEYWLRYLNVYVYVRIAIYGLDYASAAKETFQLFNYRGLDIIINDDLINPVLIISSIIVGLISSIFTFIFCILFMSNVEWQLWLLVAFMVGFSLTLCIMTTIRAGVATIIVCFAEEPNALVRTKPESYNKLRNAWTQRHGHIPIWADVQ